MRKNRKNRASLEAVEQFLKTCDAGSVQVYGPYPPCKGRTRWRVQVYCAATKRKVSLTFATQADAEQMIPSFLQTVREQSPLPLHEAIGQYIDYKAACGLQPVSLSSLRDRLLRFLPNEPILVFTPARAEELYVNFTQSHGRFGQLKAATHHAALRNAKEMWRWFTKRGLAKSNVFDAVEPIGRVNVGKPQLRETDARRLDQLLFEQARNGNEGALALLVQVYLGLRSSEVMRLLVGAVERCGEKVSIIRGKSRNAKRSLELFPDVAKLLWAHCDGRPDTERVFAANLPKAPKASWMYSRLRKHCKDAGLPLVCPHSLRGLHSSLALTSGATTHAVAAQLGHASFSTTARHYADPGAIDNARINTVVKRLRGDDGPVASRLADLTPSEREEILQALLRDKKSA